MSGTNYSGLSVGDQIAAPGAVARCGKIRIRSAEAAEVARWFGLGKKTKLRRRRASTKLGTGKRRTTRRREETLDLALAAGTITLITGPSGAGKSLLLRKIRSQRDESRRWIDLAGMRFPNVPIVNCFDDQSLIETLKLLARVGLGEAWSYLRTPAELSEGQRFRLRLAKALHVAKAPLAETRQGLATAAKAQAIIVCDEFAAVLDRLTAMIVARCLRKAIDADPAIAVVVATSHEDLVLALKPDVIVRCDFGKTSVEPQMNADERG